MRSNGLSEIKLEIRNLNILIVKLSAIGDVVHSLPFLEVLGKGFPDAEIDWLVEEAAFKIIEGHPAIRRVILSRRKLWQKKLSQNAGCLSVFRELTGFVKDLRSNDYDLIIDLQGLLKSGILVGLSKGKRKVGMSGSREGAGFFLNERPVPVNYGQHAIDRYLKVAEYLGCDSDGWSGHIPVFEPDMRSVDQILNRSGIGEKPLIAINPIAKWPTKLWDTERFAALADRIRNELRCEIAFTGSSADRSVISDIAKMMKTSPLNLAGRTNLKGLAYLYSRCRLLVTTDTGPMHIAAAMGCPVAALFGPTAPGRTGPYGKGHRVVRANAACSPCFKKKCDLMTCMKDITVAHVFEAVKEILHDQTPDFNRA